MKDKIKVLQELIEVQKQQIIKLKEILDRIEKDLEEDE